jgi:hypothetical protein
MSTIFNLDGTEACGARRYWFYQLSKPPPGARRYKPPYLEKSKKFKNPTPTGHGKDGIRDGFLFLIAKRKYF